MPRKKNRKRPLVREGAPRRPWKLVGFLSLLLTGGLAVGTYMYFPFLEAAAKGEPTTREIPLRSRDIPPETVWMVPPDESAEVPLARKSLRPVVKVRRRNDGVYELLYWGNPIRPAYTYTVTAVGLGCTALHDKAGRPQESRVLPVTVPKRADGLLPLQPVIPLTDMSAGTGEFFAARVTVRDAATGAALCSGDYLLENPAGARKRNATSPAE